MLDLSIFTKSLDGQAVYVYGLGISGLASAEALIKAGAKVIAWDDKEAPRNKAAQFGADIANYQDVDFSNIACVLLSPGIPLTHPVPHPIVEIAHSREAEVIGDVEILGRVLPHHVKTIGITGTNGKSTTTALLGHVLNECGMEAVIGGNIGNPALTLSIKETTQIVVLELSSYQIDLCPSFRPDIGVLLNISADHIERHGSLAQYAAVKARIFGHHTRPIISIDDRLSEEIFDVEAEMGKAPVIMTLKQPLPFKTDSLKTLTGKHNHQNALAVYLVCQQLELAPDKVLRAMETFPGLAHRQQIIRTIGKVTFINDSKATNAEAAGKALEAYNNIYWIVGGQAKEGGLHGLESCMPKVKKAYLIGEAANEFAGWLERENIPFDLCWTLDKAVSEAAEEAKVLGEEAVVLLSPACASWDQFNSFEHRGQVFEQCVKAL